MNMYHIGKMWCLCRHVQLYGIVITLWKLGGYALRLTLARDIADMKAEITSKVQRFFTIACPGI